MMVVLLLITVMWRNQIINKAGLLYTGTIGMLFWSLGGHEPLIVALFIPVFS